MFDIEVQRAVFKNYLLPRRPPFRTAASGYYEDRALCYEPHKVLLFHHDQLWVENLKYWIKVEKKNTDSSFTAMRRAAEMHCEADGYPKCCDTCEKYCDTCEQYDVHLHALCKASMLWAGPANLYEQEASHLYLWTPCVMCLKLTFCAAKWNDGAIIDQMNSDEQNFDETRCKHEYLAAAACRDNSLLAAQMLEEGYDFKDSLQDHVEDHEAGIWPFKPSPLWLAAFHGSNEVLQLFLERLNASDIDSYLLLVDGAIRGGHDQEFEMIITHFNFILPLPDLINNCEDFYLRRHHNPRTFERILNLPKTGDAEIEMLDISAVENKIQDLLAEAAQLGNGRMLRQLMDYGFKMFPWKDPSPGPILMAAVKDGNKGNVSMLLKQNGFPARLQHHSFGGSIIDIDFLGAAFRRGYHRIAQVLLEHDPTPDKNIDWYRENFIDAVRLEHTQMFGLLPKYGVQLGSGPIAKEALTVAITNGLESMVELLL